MKKRVLFYCQPVLGIGHYIRSREIVLSLHDFEVCFLNGGEIVPGFELPPSIEVVNLPALKSDAEFQDLHVIGGLNNLEEVKALRKQLILSVYERFRPDILILELFPFGRRKFDFELIPLLDRARERASTKVVCSLRDILVSKRNQAQYEAEVCALMNQYFDLLLIHADPEFQPLEETFPRVRDLTCEVRYTGYVVPQTRAEADERTGGFTSTDSGEVFILVSIGGGRVGHELLEAAIAAGARIEKSVPHSMHLITGPHMPEEQFARFQAQAAGRPNLTIQRFTTRFFSYLQRADLSISMAGYNTCMDLLTAGVRALVYPFTGHHNQEQTIRARKLEQLGIVKMIAPGQLEPERLAEEIIRCLRSPVAARPRSLDLQGAERTALILAESLSENLGASQNRER